MWGVGWQNKKHLLVHGIAGVLGAVVYEPLKLACNRINFTAAKQQTPPLSWFIHAVVEPINKGGGRCSEVGRSTRTDADIKIQPPAKPTGCC